MHIPVTTAGAITPITQTAPANPLQITSEALRSAHLLQWVYMEFIGSINTSYYCERQKPNGPVMVLVTGAYRVAEFDVQKGNVKWHRVVAAPQRSAIESWLTSRFPQQPEVVAAPPARKRSTRSAVATA